jgi:hypothetical protein
MEIEKSPLQPIQETAQAVEQNSVHEANVSAPLSGENTSNTKAEKPNLFQSEEETDRKQDESIASLAEQTEWTAKQTKWVKYQTIASSFLGAITLAVLVYQGMIMRKQSQVMIEQSSLMSKNLEDSRETREIENRAWVGLKTGLLHAPVKDAPRVKGILRFENVGKTPAMNCTLKTHYEYSERKRPERLDEPQTLSIGRITIMPGNTSDQEFIIELNHEAYNLAMKNRGSLYIWGILEYNDVFGMPHKTDFCLNTDSGSDQAKLYSCEEATTFS